MEFPRPMGAPECKCGVPVPVRLSRTEKNPNRWFFKCDACKYWAWADELPAYPNSSGGTGSNQQRHTPQRQGMQSSQQQQQHYQSPGIPRYQEAGHTPQGAAPFGSPAGQTPAFDASGDQQEHAGVPHSNPVQQFQSPMQQPQWHHAQQSPAQQPQGSWDQLQQQQPWQPQSPMQRQQTGWQHQQQHMPMQQLPAAPSEYPDITHQPINTFGNLQQPGMHMPLPAGPAQFNQHQQPSQGDGYGSQGSRGAGSGGPGSQHQGYGSQPQEHFLQPGQQQGYGAQQASGAGASPWPQQPQPPQQYASPGAGGSAGFGYNQYAQQQQFYSPVRPGMGMMGPAGGFGTPGGSQQQQQYNSPQQQPQHHHQYNSPQQPPPQATPMSPGSGIVVTVVPPPEHLPNHVGLKTQGYKGPFVACLNSMDRHDTDRHWEPGHKMWVVLRKSWPTVEQKLQAAGFTLREGDAVQGTPSKAMDMATLEASDARLIELMSAEDAEEIVAVANFGDLWEQLMPHQQEGVLAGVRRGGRVVLADEMGLGKTAQAILLACCYPDDWPLLVVVPASLRGVWAAEMQAWIPPALQPQREHIHTAKTGQDLRSALDAGLPSTKRQIMIVTYDLAKQIPAHIAARFGVVICDESHHLKNREARRTQSVGSLVRGARRAMLLTGTPLLSRPIEAWSQVDMLRPGLLGSFDDFGRRYCTPEGEGMASPGGGRGSACGSGGGQGGGRGFPMHPYQGCNKARADELHRLLLANVMVRRTKGQVGLTLPAKTRMKVSVPLDPSIQPQLLNIRSAMDRLSAAGEQDTPEGKRLINEYYMATGEAKVAAVVDFILGLPGVEAAQGSRQGGTELQQQDDDDVVVIVDEQTGLGRGAAAGAAAHVGSSSSSSTTGSEGKLLVFAYHHEVLNALQAKLCEAHNIGFIRIDGSTTPQQRQPLVDRFQTDASVRIGLMSIKAAGAGLTLIAASRIVFAELHWNPTDLVQCEDRIHRVGQQSHCSVYYCMAAKSADSLMWGTVVKKLKIVGPTVDGAAGGSSAQGMAGMEAWQQQLSQQQQDRAGAHANSPAAAAAVGAAAAGACADGGGNEHQQQQHASVGGPSTILPAAAAAAKSSSRRRSLLDAFMEAGDADSSGATAQQAAVVAPGQSSLLSKPPNGAPAAAAGSAGGGGIAGASGGGSHDVDELAPAGDMGTEHAPAAAPGFEAAAGSIHSNTTPSVATVPVVAAVTMIARDDEQGSGLGDAASQEVAAAAAAAKDGGGGSNAGSQAGHRAATQGSQSTMAVGDQQPQDQHQEQAGQAEGGSPAGEQTIKKQRQA